MKLHIERIIEFSKQSRVYQVVLMYLARQLNEVTVFSIQNAFNDIDKYQAGFIDHKVLIEGKALS